MTSACRSTRRRVDNVTANWSDRAIFVTHKSIYLTMMLSLADMFDCLYEKHRRSTSVVYRDWCVFSKQHKIILRKRCKEERQGRHVKKEYYPTLSVFDTQVSLTFNIVCMCSYLKNFIIVRLHVCVRTIQRTTFSHLFKIFVLNFPASCLRFLIYLTTLSQEQNQLG